MVGIHFFTCTTSSLLLAALRQVLLPPLQLSVMGVGVVVIGKLASH